jgi:hypothetical protein
LQVKLGAKPKAAHRPRWDFQQATAAQIDAMNDTITTMLESEIPYQDPTARWGTLSTLYAQAIDTHIPKQTLQPKQPWITQTTFESPGEKGAAPPTRRPSASS